MTVKVGDKVQIKATSVEFSQSTLATILDAEQPISGEVHGINDDGSLNCSGFDHVGTHIPLKAVQLKKPAGEGWYLAN